VPIKRNKLFQKTTDKRDNRFLWRSSSNRDMPLTPVTPTGSVLGRGQLPAGAPWPGPLDRKRWRWMRRSWVASSRAAGSAMSGRRRWLSSPRKCGAERRAGSACGEWADSSGDRLLPFVQEAVAPGAVVTTDGLPSYCGLSGLGYRHDRRVVLGSGESVDAVLPRVHRVASLLKRWLLGTHQGAVSREISTTTSTSLRSGSTVVPHATAGCCSTG